MALETVVAYLVAVGLPLWLVVEQIVSWWMFKKEPTSRQAGSQDPASTDPGRPMTAHPAVGPPGHARRAA